MGIDFKLSDENVLTLSSIGVGAYGAGYFFAPDKAQDLVYEKLAPRSDMQTQWHGHALGAISASGLISAASDDKKMKKKMLKLHSAGWATALALNVYNAYGGEKLARQDFCNAMIPIQVAIAGLCAWRGFKEEEDDD